MNDVTLTAEECRALHDLIDELSGGKAECGFAWDGTDNADDPLTAAMAKVFTAAGKRVPDNLRTV